MAECEDCDGKSTITETFEQAFTIYHLVALLSKPPAQLSFCLKLPPMIRQSNGKIYSLQHLLDSHFLGRMLFSGEEALKKTRVLYGYPR